MEPGRLTLRSGTVSGPAGATAAVGWRSGCIVVAVLRKKVTATVKSAGVHFWVPLPSPVSAAAAAAVAAAGSAQGKVSQYETSHVS